MPQKQILDFGYLKVRAFVAEGGMPVGGVFVSVSGNDEFNLGTEVSAITDRDGLTEKLALPAPPIALSLSSGAAEQPYATYDVFVSKEGFYPKKIYNIAVFPGVVSTLPLSMTPDAGLIRNVSPPKASNFSISQENEEL